MKNQCFVLLSRSSLAPFGQHSQLHFVLHGAVQRGLTDKQMQGHRDQLSSPTRIITIWKAKCIKTALIFLVNTTWEAGHVPASRKALFWRNGDVKPSRAPRTSVSPAPRLKHLQRYFWTALAALCNKLHTSFAAVTRNDLKNSSMQQEEKAEIKGTWLII